MKCRDCRWCYTNETMGILYICVNGNSEKFLSSTWLSREDDCEDGAKKSYYIKPWYNSYRSMMDRCYRTESASYPRYGGRGISVCEEWHSIENFENWAEKSGFEKGLTLDRIDVNGSYCPENCKWSTKKEQANNKRNTHFIEFNGEIHTISEWADITGINVSTLRNRFWKGMSIEKMLERRDLRCPNT